MVSTAAGTAMTESGTGAVAARGPGRTSAVRDSPAVRDSLADLGSEDLSSRFAGVLG